MYTMNVPLDKVVMTQPYVEKDGLVTYLRKHDRGEPLTVHVREMDGKYYVLDGHHNSVVADLVGDNTIEAIVHEHKMDYDPRVQGAYLVSVRWGQVENASMQFGTVPEFRAQQSPWMRNEVMARSCLNVPAPQERTYDRAAA